MKLSPTLLVLSISLALTACQPSNEASQSNAPTTAPPAATTEAKKPADAAELDKLYVEYWEESLKLNPLTATFVGDPRYNDQLPNFLSQEFREKSLAFTKSWLAKFEALDPSALEGQARLSYDIMVRELKLVIEGDQFPEWKQPVNQFSNMAAFIAQLGSGTNAQPFKTVIDYDNWLKRATNVPAIMTSAQENMRIGIKDGITQPKVLMQKVLPQLDALINDDPTKTIFWKPIESLPADFSKEDKERLTTAYRSLINDQLMPAYRGLRRFIAEEYLPACRDTVSRAALPNGQAWYAYLAKSSTTTEKKPEEIHDIGLREVERIQAEMRKVMEEVKFEGSLQDFFKYMTTEKKFEYASEDALLTDYRSLEARLNERVPQLFSLVPKAGFEIRPVEAFRAASAAGGSYQSPSEDGTRPGIFYVNTYDLPSRKDWDRDALYLHEAIPGHHFQIALQQELTELPKFRRFGGETAFAEGWGLYAESLGKELGAYDTPYQYFGRLQAELWRAIRLVVDTGLHSKNWTREQVIDYMKQNSATNDTEAVSEAERYVAIPGQALAYKIGELKILELRAKATQALGDKFDIREFHAEVLRDGSVPLAVLEAKIDRWIASKQG